MADPNGWKFVACGVENSVHDKRMTQALIKRLYLESMHRVEWITSRTRAGKKVYSFNIYRKVTSYQEAIQAARRIVNG